MKPETISQMISGLDEEHLIHALETTNTKKKRWSKKLRLLVAALVTTSTLVGYQKGYRLQYFVGTYMAQVMETVTPEGYSQSSSSLVFDWDAEKPYRVEDGQIYFTHDGSHRNITEFCSVNDCYLFHNVNFWGNGYLIAVGGTPDDVADYIIFFHGGNRSSSVFSTTADAEKDDYYTGMSTVYKNHQWEAAIDYEINIRDTFYLNYYSKEDQWLYVDSQKPYNPYVITVEKP